MPSLTLLTDLYQLTMAYGYWRAGKEGDEAAFYLFFSVDGFSDSRALALKLIDEAGVGAAPGSAFGPGGEGHLRICFARDPEQIAEATRRMARWLAA